MAEQLIEKNLIYDCIRLLELEQRESRERTPELGRKEEKDSISIHR